MKIQNHHDFADFARFVSHIFLKKCFLLLFFLCDANRKSVFFFCIFRLFFLQLQKIQFFSFFWFFFRFSVMALSRDYCTGEPYYEGEYDLRIQKIGSNHYRAFKRISMGNWKTNTGVRGGEERERGERGEEKGRKARG